MQGSEELRARVGLGLAPAVDGATVDLEGHALLHQVLHGLECRPEVARVELVDKVQGVVEARHEVEVTDERAAQTVMDLGLQPVVGPAERIPVPTEVLVAEGANLLLGAVDAHGHG